MLITLNDKCTQIYLAVKMKELTLSTRLRGNEFLKCVIYNRNSDVYI